MKYKLLLWLGRKVFDGMIEYNYRDRQIGVLFYRKDSRGMNREVIDEHVWEKDEKGEKE